MATPASIVYGLTWDESADTYARTGSTVGQATGASPGNAWLPIQALMRRCVINDAGVVQYYLSATDSTLKADGVTPSVLDGTDGQVMVEIPAFWYRHAYAGTTHTWEIATGPASGFSLHPAFMSGSTVYSRVFVGAYEAVLYDVSAAIYANGIYQTAWSCTFAAADKSITANSRTNPFSGLAVGDKLVISGTVSNNGTFTVASLVSATKITTTEALVNETAAATVVETQKNWTATTGDKLASVAGKRPITYGTRAEFRIAAANRGTGWTQELYDIRSAVQLLYLVEYASFYSQSVIGAGISNVGDWPAYNDYNPIAPTGNSNPAGNATANTGGAATAAAEVTKHMTYRGIENWYGHIWSWLDGINTNNNRSYVCNVAASLADDTTTGYTDIGVNNHNSNGYQATLLNIARGFLPASVAGGSSSTKVTDYYWQAAGWLVAASGGYANSGEYVGAFCLNLSSGAGIRYRFIGGRAVFRG
jgi:hypothetical protein